MVVEDITFQLRQNTEEEFQRKNQVYLAGEPICVITDGGGMRMKIGDGIRAYNDLPFVLAPVTDNAVTGDLSNLTTNDKSNLVAAINELNLDGISLTVLYANAKAG